MPESIKIKKAKEFAQQQLGEKPRISGESYFDHSHNVYKTLIKTGIKDEGILLSALLHHIDSSKDKLVLEYFGEEVLTLVHGIRKLSDYDIQVASPKQANDKYFIQTYLNLTKDIRVLIVRLVDKAVNIKTAYVHTPQKAREIGEKALYLYAPICRLLGISSITTKLENEAFKLLYPSQYYNIERIVEKKKPEINKFFLDAVPFLQTILAENNINAEIKTRIKHLFSIYRKSLKYSGQKNQPNSIYEQVLDVAGMRIIVDTIEQCYLVEDILKGIWEYIPEHRDDYIKTPKPRGYRSLHNIFKVGSGMHLEIQIRTFEMHQENEYGNASHFVYKIGDKFKEKILENPNWLKEINFWENQTVSSQGTELAQFNENVYAFTPKGDIIELPRGANIIDFAYHIHGKLGHACSGGLVNGNMVKLEYEINDGDHVTILTSKHSKKPSIDWLKIAKTKKALSMIRKALTETK